MKNSIEIKRRYNNKTEIRKHIGITTLAGMRQEYIIYAPNTFEASKDLHSHLNLTPIKKLMTTIEIEEIKK